MVEYLKDTPSVEALDLICTQLGKEPQDIVRKKEGVFAELGVGVIVGSRLVNVIETNPENLGKVAKDLGEAVHSVRRSSC